VIWLLRHGDTGVRGAPVGQRDVPLTTAAQAAWPRVRAQLLALRPALVASSDLARAHEPAADLGLPHVVDARLREQAFGAWEGQPWGAVGADHPFWRDPIGNAPPDGESFAQLAMRVAVPAARPLLVIAHAGPLRALAARCTGNDLAWALALPWDHFGLTQINGGTLAFHNRILG
jgi:broad specificity phosphatase PhoE